MSTPPRPQRQHSTANKRNIHKRTGGISQDFGSLHTRASVPSASRDTLPPRSKKSSVNERASHRDNSSTRRCRINDARKAQRSVQASSRPARSIQKKESSLISRAAILELLHHLGKILVDVLCVVGKVLGWIARALLNLGARSRPALICMLLVTFLLMAGLIDLGMQWNRAYPGVHVGRVDVGGKTADEMREALNATYGSSLRDAKATIYASQEDANNNDQATQEQDSALAEQQTLEQQLRNKRSWFIEAQSLEADLPVNDLVTQALQIGRENGGIVARIAALFLSWNLPVQASFNADKVGDLASQLNNSLGNPHQDYDISVSNGRASVVEGHDGSEVALDDLEGELSRAFLSDTGEGSFVAHEHYAPVQIGQQEAQRVADEVNDALAPGVRFFYEDASWEASATDLGEWVTTQSFKDSTGYHLIPSLDEQRSKPSLLARIQEKMYGLPGYVTFDLDGDTVSVNTDNSSTIPLVADAAQALQKALFETPEGVEVRVNETTACREGTTDPVQVWVQGGTPPAPSGFDEALDLGIIGKISSYTTTYTDNAGAKNRNSNIHKVADLLNNSIIQPGDSWSFNDTSGECNADRGFLGAGAILNGEYDTAIGGGICQVATTVFNAVYDAGYPILTRHNHTLYIASYPAGRDAAVSWPDLDLVWTNDASSQILLKTSYTDSSISVSLYGVNPGYKVSSEVGEWLEGKKHDTKTIHDDKLAPGKSYVKTAGTDGKKITVVRSVSSSDAEILHRDTFKSTYDPVDEIIVAGPDKPDTE